MPYIRAQERGVARVLHRLCDLSAGIGCTLLLGMAGVTVTSVIGRALFASPILGDVELVQLGGAVCVASFLPYTQFRGANIIVDFFTQKSGARSRAMLDGIGTLLYALVMALVCWRVWAGGLAARENAETSMLMGIPLWIPYFGMLPGLALAAAVGAWQTAEHALQAWSPEVEAQA